MFRTGLAALGSALPLAFALISCDPAPETGQVGNEHGSAANLVCPDALPLMFTRRL